MLKSSHSKRVFGEEKSCLGPNSKPTSPAPVSAARSWALYLHGTHATSHQHRGSPQCVPALRLAKSPDMAVTRHYRYQTRRWRMRTSGRREARIVTRTRLQIHRQMWQNDSYPEWSGSQHESWRHPCSRHQGSIASRGAGAGPGPGPGPWPRIGPLGALSWP